MSISASLSVTSVPACLIRLFEFPPVEVKRVVPAAAEDQIEIVYAGGVFNREGYGFPFLHAARIRHGTISDLRPGRAVQVQLDGSTFSRRRKRGDKGLCACAKINSLHLDPGVRARRVDTHATL